MESLKEKTAKGILWGGMNNFIQQALGLCFGIMMGRLLSPDDYGMIAMITIFQQIAITLQNSGFTVALTNIKQPGHREYNSVFWFNVIVGTAMYALLFFCAPLIADYYHTDKLVPLCRYAFLNILFASFATAQSAYLFKNLMVKQQAKAGMTAVLCSNIVGVSMAFSGMGYWSLATQGLVFVGVNTVLLWRCSPWRPSLRIDFGPVRRMFRFSVKVLATGILNNVNSNVLNILLGRYFSPYATGCYNQAYQWDNKCYYLVQGTVQQVTQPAGRPQRAELAPPRCHAQDGEAHLFRVVPAAVRPRPCGPRVHSAGHNRQMAVLGRADADTVHQRRGHASAHIPV